MFLAARGDCALVKHGQSLCVADAQMCKQLFLKCVVAKLIIVFGVRDESISTCVKERQQQKETEAERKKYRVWYMLECPCSKASPKWLATPDIGAGSVQNQARCADILISQMTSALELKQTEAIKCFCPTLSKVLKEHVGGYIIRNGVHANAGSEVLNICNPLQPKHVRVAA
eukprot:scaffold42157_cov17-Tisochrysis_lutea.AAC.4